MTDNPFNIIRDYDRLEALLALGGQPPGEEADELTAELAVVRLLVKDAAAPIQMPRQEAFRRQLRDRLQPRGQRPWWAPAGLVVAAALVAGLLLVLGPWDGESGIIVDAEMLAVADREGVKGAMVDYLEEAERLLQAIRDYEPTCGKDQADLELERHLATSLLLRQKHFVSEMNKPQFFQARELFSQLEAILVDLNGLESCTDVFELEFLNDHISKNRILSKVRIVAQDIEFS